MAKKRNLIKRVYERGQERTVSSSVRRKKNKAAGSSYRVQKQHSPSEKTIAPSVSKSSQTSYAGQPKPEYQPARRSAAVVTAPRVFAETYEFPSSYNVTQITLMVKDPYWIYAYWDINPSSIEYARNLMSEEESRSATIVVRIYEVSLLDFNGYNANYFFDLDVGFHSSNWYINLWNDCGSFVVDLGLRAGNGKFVQLARSNHVHTPRQGYAPRSEQIWMSVEANGNKKAYALMRPRVQRPSNIRQMRPALSKNKRRISLSEEDIRAYYGNLSPLLREVIASRLGKGTVRKGQSINFVIEGESVRDRQLLLKSLPESFFIKKILTGASEFLVIVGQREHVAGSFGASDFLHQKVTKRRFFFEIDAELIVYGKTEPDASVWLGSKNVSLRPDGTFTLRFALPDGNIPLEFTAESFDKQEKRRINTYVERRTEYPI